jgi:hypothetical protein
MKNFEPAGFLMSAFLLAGAGACVQGCRHDAGAYLKGEIVGNWEEVHGTKETLQFNPDGTLTMISLSEHHECRYDFPDSKYIRLDCTTAGMPPRPQVWKVAITSDHKLLISDAVEVGTYRRK